MEEGEQEAKVSAKAGEASPIVRTTTREDTSSSPETRIFSQSTTPISNSATETEESPHPRVSILVVSTTCSNRRSIRTTSFGRRLLKLNGGLIIRRPVKAIQLALLPLSSIKTRCLGRLRSVASVNGHGLNPRITVNGNTPKRHRLLAPRSLLFYRITSWRITLRMITGEIFTFTYRGIC